MEKSNCPYIITQYALQGSPKLASSFDQLNEAATQFCNDIMTEKEDEDPFMSSSSLIKTMNVISVIFGCVFSPLLFYVLKYSLAVADYDVLMYKLAVYFCPLFLIVPFN